MFCTTLALAMLIAAPAPKDKPKASAIPVGEWEVTELTQGGQNLVALVGQITIKIEEKSLTMTVMGQSHKLDVEWDTTKTPGIIKELKNNAFGIFKVEDGILSMCMNEKPDMPLPTDFTATEKGARSLMVLKKITKKE